MNSTPLFNSDPDSRAGFSGLDLLRMVFKYLWVVVTCVLVVGAIAVYGAMLQPSLFTATAQVWVKTDQQGTPSFLTGITSYREATAQDPPNRRIETEMSLLMNRSSIEHVVTQFNLRPEQWKRKALATAIGPLTKFIKRVGQVWGSTSNNAVDTMAETVKVFNESVTIEPLRSKGADTTSNVIEITLTGTDGALTQAVLSALLDEYTARTNTLNAERGKQTLMALKAQTNSARADLAAAEQAMVEYAVGAAAATVNSSQPRADGESSYNPSAPTATAKLRTDVHQLEAQLDSLRATYTDEYEGVRSVKQSLDKLRARMLNESRETAVVNTRMTVLDRSRSMAQIRYVELQRKLDQIDLYLKLAPADAEGRSQVEPPRAPEKLSRMPRFLTMVAGPMVGLLLGLMLAALLDLGDRRLQSREAVLRHLQLDVLAALPRLSSPTMGKQSGGSA